MNSDESKTELQPPIEISPEQLSTEILNAIVEEFVLREGTDYGEVEYSSYAKTNQVLKQIKSGDVKIVFDPSTETVTLLTKNDFRKLQNSERLP